MGIDKHLHTFVTGYPGMAGSAIAYRQWALRARRAPLPPGVAGCEAGLDHSGRLREFKRQ